MLVLFVFAGSALAEGGKSAKSGQISPKGAAAGASVAPDVLDELEPSRLRLKSSAALVYDEESGQILYDKNAGEVTPIASITKLMTAIVVLEAKLPMDEAISISSEDVDHLKGTRSRLRVGTELTREDLLRLALMASENRAAAALGRTYPGGTALFVAQMNIKARQLGMHNTRFADATGLNSDNVSTAEDLVKLVEAAHGYPLIQEFTTLPAYSVKVRGYRHPLKFGNSNRLVRSPNWEIGLSKTGYISEAGRCLVMRATIAGRDLVIVLLDSWGKNTRLGDANRIRKWIESALASGSIG